MSMGVTTCSSSPVLCSCCTVYYGYLHNVCFSAVKLSVSALRKEKTVVADGGSVVDVLPTHVTFCMD